MWIRGIGRRLAAALASLSPAGKTILAVAAAHAAALAALAIDHAVSHQVRTARPLAIRHREPPVSLPVKKASPPSATKPKPSAKPAKTPSPRAAKAGGTLRPAKAPMAAPKAELFIPSAVVAPTIAIATATPTENPEPSQYGPALALFLQEQLLLPEIGEVVVKLLLKTPGTLAEVEIIDAKSQKNADFLKNRLPFLELPCFNDYGVKDATIQFMIVFSNVENP